MPGGSLETEIWSRYPLGMESSHRLLHIYQLRIVLRGISPLMALQEGT
jgi:hypothetical protein